ncbi:hypothetical protein NDU88_003528 [Pleurodeles waltl]|uniref:Uncharacterized protein n=1 Tax=Pleurodeles waltl TaxID=8319 RepID=A0AAV7QAB2_PLEWA|nr:hypothetical protein NDU88_003528 [Pleurodeles waltl]
MVAVASGGADMLSVEEPELKQILAAMQQSLTQLDTKIDSCSFRMDRMTEQLNRHAEHLDQSEAHFRGGGRPVNYVLRRQFIAGKRQLRDLRLEYRMLYPDRFRVTVDGKPLLFTDHKNLTQFLKRRMAERIRHKTVDTLSRDGCE